jgi:hypothetical protein
MKNQTKLFLIALFFLTVHLANAQNVTNNGSAISVSEGAVLTVMGNITFLSDAIIENSGDIFIGGDWINNAPDRIDMKENTGTVTFNGSLPQTIGGISETHFSTLQLEQHTQLGSETKVSTLLGLNNARLTLNDHHFLILSGAEITGAGAGAYIVTEGIGLLVREVGDSDVEFPVGTSSSFLPVTINNSGTPDNYGINLFPDVRDGGLTGSTIPEIDHCVNNTWNILEEVGGGSDLSITVQWNASDEGAGFNRSLSGLGHYTDGAWSPQDAVAAFGDDPYSLTRTGITSLSAFAVGDNN